MRWGGEVVCSWVGARAPLIAMERWNLDMYTTNGAIMIVDCAGCEGCTWVYVCLGGSGHGAAASFEHMRTHHESCARSAQAACICGKDTRTLIIIAGASYVAGFGAGDGVSQAGAWAVARRGQAGGVHFHLVDEL